MGMFDDVRPLCELPPGAPGPDAGWQTKSWHRIMARLEITEEGRLRHCPSEDDMALRSPHDVHFHGVLNFYTSADDGCWWELDAKFSDGQLQGLIQVSPKPGKNPQENET